MDHRSETTLQNLGVAAVATAVHETHIMYISVLCRVHFVLLTLIYSSDDLPEISELNHEAWRSQIQDFLDRVEAEMKFREQQALVQHPGPIGQAALQDPKAPQPGTPVSPTLPRKRSPLRLVLDGSLNYPVLVKERREHETAEAQASLPWRYRATLTGHIQTIPPEPTPSTSTHPSSGSEALPTVETEKLHVKLVNEIVRVTPHTTSNQVNVLGQASNEESGGWEPSPGTRMLVSLKSLLSRRVSSKESGRRLRNW